VSVSRSPALRGVIAGAAGTVALNLCAYLDMAITCRAPSDVPAAAARAIARRLGFEPAPPDDAEKRARWEGFGEALGLMHGVVQGLAYGIVRANFLPRAEQRTGALCLALESFVLGESAATALGATDPRRWGFAGFVRGLALRLAFGAVTAATFDALPS